MPISSLKPHMTVLGLRQEILTFIILETRLVEPPDVCY
jgi:hypothetical protein